MLQLLPDQLQVFLASMLPVLELRFAIPYGMAALGMSKWEAFFWAISGNLISAYILIQWLDPVIKLFRKYLPFMDRFFNWLFRRTRHRHNKRMSELGHIALLMFVAIPLPGSGSWTGALVAYVFGVKKHISILMVSGGLVIAGLLVTFGTQGILNLAGRVLGG